MMKTDEIEIQRADAQLASAGEVRHVLEEYLTLHDHFAATESTTGHILEVGRLGTVSDPDDWKRAHATDERYQRYALLVKLWAAIQPLPRVLLRLQLEPCGWQSHERLCRKGELQQPEDLAARQGGLCLEGKASGGLCRNPLLPGEFTCAAHRDRIAVGLKVMGRTARGETFLRYVQPRDFPPGVEPEEGWVVVEGRRDVHPSARMIAEGLSADFDDVLPSYRETPGRGTSYERQIANIARNSLPLLQAERLSRQGAREILGARQGVVHGRRVSYLTEQAFKVVRGSELFRLLRGQE